MIHNKTSSENDDRTSVNLPVRYPAVGVFEINRSCFWSLYSAHTDDFSRIALTLSPRRRLRVIAFNAFTICALVVAGLSIESNRPSRMFRRYGTISASNALDSNEFYLYAYRKNILHTHIRSEIFFNPTFISFKPF